MEEYNKTKYIIFIYMLGSGFKIPKMKPDGFKGFSKKFKIPGSLSNISESFDESIDMSMDSFKEILDRPEIQDIMDKLGINIPGIITCASNQMTDKFLSVSSIVLLLITSLLIIAIGISGMSMYNKCPDKNKDSAVINKLGSTFSIGFGVGIILFIIFSKTLHLNKLVPLIIIIILLIAVSSASIYSLNILKSNKTITPADINKEMDKSLIFLGISFGLLVSMILGYLPLAMILKIRVFIIIISLFAIVFGSIGINTYMKCDKQSNSKGEMSSLAIFMGVAGIALIGTIVSFKLYKGKAIDLPF